MDHDATPTTETSERFCAADSDITLKSSDGVLFKTHRRNLETHSQGFAGAGAISPFPLPSEEIIQLPESSGVLEILLQFIYNDPLPDLTQIAFILLDSVADAAEKYEMYSLMMICKFVMTAAIPNHTVAVLHYAVKHHYPDIADMTAPLLLELPATDIAATMPAQSYAIWARYLQHWLDAVNASYAQLPLVADHNGTSTGYPVAYGPCTAWRDVVVKIFNFIRAEPRKLFHICDDEFLSSVSCDRCQCLVDKWLEFVEKRLDGLPKLSSLM